VLKYILSLFVLLVLKSPLFALVVFVVAMVFERNIKLGRGAVNPLSSPKRRAVFLKSTFQLMGKLAKADGKVSVEEIQHSEHVFNTLGLTSKTREQAINYFKQGVASNFDMHPVLDEFMQVCGRTRNLPLALLEFLLTLAFADGQLHEKEKQVLAEIAERLGISRIDFENLLGMMQGRYAFAGGKVPAKNALQEAYKALGLSESVSDQDLKRAYRKLMSQHHPDKLMGQGMPEDMVKIATEKAKEIQKAYELIKTHRQL